MHFWFNLMNHCHTGQSTLHDVIGIMGKQLRALGHEATFDPSNKHFIPRERGYNIVVEGFTNPVMIETMAEHHALGARFICLATEEPSDKGFNHGVDPEMAERQWRFGDAAPFLDAIIHLVPGQRVTDWYAQHAPSAYVELGHAPELERFTAQEPEFMFGFFGSLSLRRLAIINKLRAAVRPGKKAVRLVYDFPDQNARDAAMREAKVIIQIRKFDAMGLVSSSRCNTALHLGRPVVAEPHELCEPWDQVVKFSKTTDAFVFDALAAAMSWRGTHAGQYERFKRTFTPEMSIGTPLRKIGILPLNEERAVA